MLLNRFGVERKKGKFQVWVFDKAESRKLRMAVEDVTVEGDFNALTLDNWVMSFEEALGRVEDLAAPHLAQIVATTSIADLSVEARGAICIFAALQFIRGRDSRIKFADMAEKLRDRLMAEGVAPGSQAEEFLKLPEPKDLKIHSFQMIQNHLGEFAAHFVVKDLLLLEAPQEHEFLIGDAPVVMSNSRDFGPMGNIGLAVLGIEIYLPISPKLTLAFYCPSLLGGMRESLAHAQAEIRRLKALTVLGRADVAVDAGAKIAQLQPGIEYNEAVLSAHRVGSPLLCVADNMFHCNSLQIAGAERWIISRSGDFGLVDRMISDNPKFRAGRRATFF